MLLLLLLSCDGAAAGSSLWPWRSEGQASPRAELAPGAGAVGLDGGGTAGRARAGTGLRGPGPGALLGRAPHGLPAEAAALRARARSARRWPSQRARCPSASLSFRHAVPLLDRLGAFLALGTVTSVALVLLVGPALLRRPTAVWPHRSRSRAAPGGADSSPSLPSSPSSRAWLSAGSRSAGGPAWRPIADLAPSGLTELRGVEALQRDLGTSGQVRIAVRANDVTAPDVVSWMGKVRDRAIERSRGWRRAPTWPNSCWPVATTAVDRRKWTASCGCSHGISPTPWSRVTARSRRSASGSRWSASPSRGGSSTGSGPHAEHHPGRGHRDRSRHRRRLEHDALESTRPGLLLLAAALIAVVLLAAWRDPRRFARPRPRAAGRRPRGPPAARRRPAAVPAGRSARAARARRRDRIRHASRHALPTGPS